MNPTELLSLLQKAQEGSSFREKSGLPEAEDVSTVLVSRPEDFLKKYVDVLMSGKLLG